MKYVLLTAISIILPVITGQSLAHGLMESPPSRNWYCGALTKPHEVYNHIAEFPQCGEAFNNSDFFTDGYQFMSVLTHDRGRSVVSPLPEHVCGFASETFNYGETLWDTPMDWPTSAITPGYQEISWNIQWGPHFSDTEEFRYWITREDFQFDPAKPLTWNDFEATEFCALKYDDSDPYGNPDIIPLKESSRFRTFCTIPERNGRHVIYGEWGRNQWTFERFHGCIDVVFEGGVTPPEPVVAEISQPDIVSFVGAGEIILDGSASTGENLNFMWSVNALDNSLYRIDADNQALTTLTLTAPKNAQQVEISLLVTNGNATSSTLVNFLHEPEQSSGWVDLGPLTAEPIALNQGDGISIRIISDQGVDSYIPSPPLLVTFENGTADVWPLILAQAINDDANSPVAIGVLDGQGEIAAVQSSTDNRIYRRSDAAVNHAYLQIDETGNSGSGSENCEVTIRDGSSNWWAGMDIATDYDTVLLDFNASGMDLSENLIVDPGNFSVTIDGQIMRLNKPFWVTLEIPGYLGFNADNNPSLADFSPPICRTE